MDNVYNPIIDKPGEDMYISFRQDKNTMGDAELYNRFITSICNNLYKSRFYKDYKSYIMGLGFNMDMTMPGITTEVANVDLHHQLPSLKQAAICITEYLIATKGCANTLDVNKILEDTHRNNEIAVIMLSKTKHQAHHANPADFISVRQCIGFPERFIAKYAPYMTLDIAYDILLKLKQEEQHGKSFTPMMVAARNELLSWYNYNGRQQNGIFLPYNQNFYAQGMPYYGYIYPYTQVTAY